jgi:ABC-type lipoprotein export system ATPase subunit
MVENFSARFERGTATAFRETGGCGTGLLLNILGMIERPDSGHLEVLGRPALDLVTGDALRLRDQSFGYLFTHPHLLPSFTVGENIAMPFLRLREDSAEEAGERVGEVLEFAGLAKSLASSPTKSLDAETLWRIAFARAIVHGPEIMVAISPPALFLLPLARRYARERGACVLWNVGDANPEADCDRMIEPPARSASHPTE